MAVMEQDKNHVYTQEDIKTLDDLEHIRLRPSTYIGEIYEPGIFKIDLEAIENSIDEFSIGVATKCEIIHDTNTGYMSVTDDGRGIPVEKLIDIFTKQHTGGKFNNKAYASSIGSNGLGSKIITALSKWMKVEVYKNSYTDKDGKIVPIKHGIIEFENCKLINSLFEDLDTMPAGKCQGTKVEYIVDENVLKTKNHPLNKIREYLTIASYVNAGFHFDFIVDGKKEIYQHNGGLKEYMGDFIKSRKAKILFDPIYLEGEGEQFDFKCIFTYCTSQSGDSNVISFVNGNRTPGHGYHVSSFKTGCSMALTQYINETDAIPKGLKNLNVTGALVSDNVFGLIGMRHMTPLFDGQTKDAFKNMDVVEPIKAAVRTTFLKWLHANPNAAKRLVNMAIDYAKYEAEKKKLKKNILETKQQKSAFAANGIDPSKYSPCRSKNPEEKELFIVEGQSAGGNANLMMDHEYQALYMLTGKILNVAKASKNNLSKVVLELIQILGMGLPGQVNYKNLQFNKIIIMTDADDDGAHIATLLLTFLYTFYPKVIEDGHVYIAEPPIKEVKLSNGNSFYLHTEADYNRLMTEFIVNSFELHSEKSKKRLSDGLFRVFVNKCFDYDNIVDNHSNALCIPQDLLELIVIYVNDLLGGNYKKFERAGYKVGKFGTTFNFDYGTSHTFLDFNDSFIDGAYHDIFKKLQEIHIYGVYLKGIRSGEEYHGTLYKLIKIMNGILGKGVKIIRYKGLGEQSKDSLYETALDPKTRMMTAVSMNDVEKAKRSIEIFMDDVDPDFKRKFFSGDLSFD